jgi:hypothetical protein
MEFPLRRIARSAALAETDAGAIKVIAHASWIRNFMR